jgi:hypothetical protein
MIHTAVRLWRTGGQGRIFYIGHYMIYVMAFVL